MLCHAQKCIFVHIPKTAGQSIERAFLELAGTTWEQRAPFLLRYNGDPNLGPPRLAHLTADDYIRFGHVTEDEYRSYYKFAFVRDPWARAISLYKQLKYESKCDFKSFIGTHLKQLFDEMYWFVRPQADFIYSSNDELLVDFVGRFERLQTDFDQVCQRLNISPRVLPSSNKSQHRINVKLTARWLVHMAQVNRLSAFKTFVSYAQYYDAETEQAVREIYNRDVRLLGYERSSVLRAGGK